MDLKAFKYFFILKKKDKNFQIISMEEKIWSEFIRILIYRNDLVDIIKPFMKCLNNNLNGGELLISKGADINAMDIYYHLIDVFFQIIYFKRKKEN